MNKSEVFKQNNFDLEPPLINYSRLLFSALKYWYLILTFLLFTLTIAFLVNRWSTPLYPTSASIIVKESEEAGQSAELLYNNPLINPYRNFLNEPYIIRSYPLVQKVIDTLGLTTAFFTEGNITTIENYKVLPIHISGNKKNDRAYLSGEFDFVIDDNENFTLITRPSEKAKDEVELIEYHGKFNKTILIKGFPILFKADKLGKFIGKEYLLVFYNGFGLAIQFSGNLSISWAEEGASVLNLSVNGPVPPKSADFINMLIELYRSRDLDHKRQVAKNSINFIDEQLGFIADSLSNIEGDLERFKDDNTLVNFDEEARRIYYKIESFEDEKVTYLVKNRYYIYLKEYLTDTTGFDQIVLPTSVGVSDPLLTNLVTQMSDLQLEAKSIRQTPSEENPLAKLLYQQIIDLNKAILLSINSLEQTDKIDVEQLDSEIKKLDNQLLTLPNIDRQYVAIQRKYRQSEQMFIFLNQKRTEAAISEVATVSDIVVVNPPLSSIQITPNTKRNYLFAAVMGLSIPIGILLLVQIFNTKIRHKEDVENITKIPILGVVGHNYDMEALVVSNKPKSYMAEAFRSLRSNLNYFIEREKYILMVTSSISGEGKSFNVLNLASVIALTGKKTLILGADMRKPRMYKQMELSNTLGLSTYLTGKLPLAEVIQESTIPNLSLISSGPIPPNPGELLLRPDFKELLVELQNQFDVVLVDTPPIGIVADALEVQPLVDHTIFIVRQNYTPIEAVKNVNSQATTGKLNNISIVYNDVKRNGGGYGYGYGSYSKGYYDDDVEYTSFLGRLFKRF